MSIVTGKMLPDEGKVEWSKYVTAGYLINTQSLLKGSRCVSAPYSFLMSCLKQKSESTDLYMEMAEDGADVDALMEEVGELQDRLRVVISIPWMLRLTKWACPWCHGL